MASAVDIAAEAIRRGDVELLRTLLEENTGLVLERTAQDGGMRSLLHEATDWPGHFPRVEESISMLLESSADVNVRCSGKSRETPLHWAASSNDTAAMQALLLGGADVDIDGSCINGGTPLTAAVAFNMREAAELLVSNGASLTHAWVAASLGNVDRMRSLLHDLQGEERQRQANFAVWSAASWNCLESLSAAVDEGGDIGWVGHDGLTPLQAANRQSASAAAAWLIKREVAQQDK